MDVDEKYFKSISKRERAIFEGAITMGALFHQFVGTPVSLDNVDILEKSIKKAMELQPCIEEVEIKIDRKMLADKKSQYNYVSLTGDMMDVRVISDYQGKKTVIRMKYIESLKYPLMYVEDVR